GPMKCQRKASPCRVCLASRSWARFSPTTSIPAPASTGSSSASTYFVAATIVTSGPSSPRIRSRFAPTVLADKPENALDATRLSCPSLGEEEVRVAGGAEVEAVDPGDAGRAQRPLGGAPEVELAVAQEPKAEGATKRLGHVFTHLVAARADSGADDRGNQTAPEGGDSLRRKALEQAAPTCMQDRER